MPTNKPPRRRMPQELRRSHCGFVTPQRQPARPPPQLPLKGRSRPRGFAEKLCQTIEELDVSKPAASRYSIVRFFVFGFRRLLRHRQQMRDPQSHPYRKSEQSEEIRPPLFIKPLPTNSRQHHFQADHRHARGPFKTHGHWRTFVLVIGRHKLALYAKLVGKLSLTNAPR